MMDAPVIDARSRDQIVSELLGRIGAHVPGWQGEGDATGMALVQIFARYMEIVIERLNRVPDKNFLAFLDMMGVSLLPPRPAMAPLRFFLAEGAKADAVVPSGTQVATAGSDPQVFETERQLTVTPANLVKAITYDPGGDTYEDHGSAEGANSFSVFAGAAPIDHILYLGDETVFNTSHPGTMTLTFSLSKAGDEQLSLFNSLSWWTRRDGNVVQIPGAKSSRQDSSLIVTLPKIHGVESWTINGMMSRWIWARMEAQTPRPFAPVMLAGISVQGSPDDFLLPDMAMANTQPLDLSKGGFPFGERPKMNDTFYLASEEVFSKGSATATVKATLTPEGKPNNLNLQWEYWNGKAWSPLILEPSCNFSNPTEKASFDIPSDLQPCEVGGKLNYWIRARIAEGNYGEDPKVTFIKDPPQTLADVKYEKGTLWPPYIAALSLSYQFKKSQPVDAMVAYNNFAYQSPAVTGGFQPFQSIVSAQDEDPALYLGFDRPFSNNEISIYLPVEEHDAVASPPLVTWEYWNGKSWINLGARDETKNLTQPGIVAFMGPAGMAADGKFGCPQALNWIRVRLLEGSKGGRICGVFSNVVWAVNVVTLAAEVIGSSSGKPGQHFRLAKFPVLEGEVVEVREPESPTAAEISLLREEGENEPVREAVRVASGADTGVWVRWRAVEHFHLSGPTSRHYTIDRAGGEITFGDGAHGMIPPPGRDNIRAARYRAGGGSRGNVPAGAITVMKRAVPFIDGVTNPWAAGGGSDLESLDDVRTRGPLILKHRDRAVSHEDYEWLAREASVQVARAHCIPSSDAASAGVVKLIVIPQSDEDQPFPSQGLLREVCDFLAARRLPTVTLQVAGPAYVPVSVTAEVVPESFEDADVVRRRVVDGLTTFLHPLTGGPEGKGWDFGRDVYVPEISALIEGIEGVQHVRGISLGADAAIEGRAHTDGKPSVVLKGEGTRFEAELATGDIITIAGIGRRGVTSIQSDTSLTMDAEAKVAGPPGVTLSRVLRRIAIEDGKVAASGTHTVTAVTS